MKNDGVPQILGNSFCSVFNFKLLDIVPSHLKKKKNHFHKSKRLGFLFIFCNIWINEYFSLVRTERDRANGPYLTLTATRSNLTTSVDLYKKFGPL